MLVIGADGKVNLINRKGCEVLEYSQDEIVGKDWIKNFIPKRQRLQIGNKFMSITSGDEKEFSYGENYVITKSGEEKLIAWYNTVVYNDSGKIIGTLSSGEDITERKRMEEKIKQSESKYRTVFNLSPEVILLMDKKGKILDVNQKAYELLGYSIDDLIGTKIFDFIPLDLKSKAKVLKNFALRMIGKKLDPYELTFTGKNGEKITGIVRAKAIRNSKGEIVNNLAVISDITGLKNYEIELINAKENAERSDRMKSEFLAQMSHEIRTPINAILSFASLIEEQVSEHLDEDLEASFKLMEGAGRRIIRTIDLILNMSDLQTGNYEYRPQKINVDNGVISKVMDQNRSLADEKNLNISVKVETDDTFIFADEHSVTNIIDALVDNAIKYTQKGSVEINLSRNVEKQFIIKVIDTGVGIAEEYIPYLFKPFSQEEQGYTRKYEGNGLGLALVKGYCDLNNAEIFVESKKGIGTTFTVVFR